MTIYRAKFLKGEIERFVKQYFEEYNKCIREVDLINMIERVTGASENYIRYVLTKYVYPRNMARREWDRDNTFFFIRRYCWYACPPEQ
jgi:hypothetical protein